MFEQDISKKKLLELGLAIIYQGRDAVFGGKRAEYAAAESKAKRMKRGIWSQKNFETPAEFKNCAKSQLNQ